MGEHVSKCIYDKKRVYNQSLIVMINIYFELDI